VLLGATLGLLGYLFDPFGKAINHTPAPVLLLAYVTSLLLLPSPQVGGRPEETQALNGPAWSLMLECPALFVPVKKRQTGTRGALYGTREETYSRADREPAAAG
jgi:hypothetical protein